MLKNTTDFDLAIRKFNLSEMQKPDSFVLKYGSNIDVKKRQSVIENFKNSTKRMAVFYFKSLV